ncbi:MAG: hypothetical protein QNJ55_20385 [Xenococcus sp. MO_188.B8]|nr:hypothetical protein [Xenococcus sp. MO_188.B8]
MKFLLFKILLLHRTRDRGFTLPMVIGIGLIMVLLSSVGLLQSSEENLIAISKEQSSTSLAMAELGIARYRELLNNNRVLAIYSLDNPDWGWTNTDISNQTCDVISDDPGGWANNTDQDGWRDITLTLNENVYGADLNFDGDQIDTISEPIGSYRLVNYIYDNDDDIDPANDDTDTDEDGIFDQTSDAANPDEPKGILTVQGRDNSDGSIAQIQVDIPIGVNTEDLNTLDPGIWIHQSDEAAINFGTITFTSGNLVLYRAAGVTADVRCADFTPPGTVTGTADTEFIRDPRDLPPLVELPDPPSPLVPEDKINILESDGGGGFDDIAGDGRFIFFNPGVDDKGELILGTLAAGEITNSDDAGTGYTGDDRYYYFVGADLDNPSDLTINDGQSIITDGEAEVIIYVDGDLNINGEVKIENSSDSASSRYLEIHVTGDVNITSSDTVEIKGLIHAPDGTVNITGSPTIELTGSIWAEDWDGANGNVIVDSSEYEYYSITPERTPRPLTYEPTGWEQQEAE